MVESLYFLDAVHEFRIVQHMLNTHGCDTVDIRIGRLSRGIGAQRLDDVAQQVKMLGFFVTDMPKLVHGHTPLHPHTPSAQYANLHDPFLCKGRASPSTCRP